jgi:glutaredoxin-related protein
MPRPILDEAHIHPAIRDRIANHQQWILDEVMSAIEGNDVVVVGMGMNPWPAKARQALDAAGQPYKYLEYGNYLTLWRERNALKMWTGWPTFPMVFVKGTLVGGYIDLRALMDSGELPKMLGPKGRTRKGRREASA